MTPRWEKKKIENTSRTVRTEPVFVSVSRLGVWGHLSQKRRELACQSSVREISGWCPQSLSKGGGAPGGRRLQYAETLLQGVRRRFVHISGCKQLAQYSGWDGVHSSLFHLYYFVISVIPLSHSPYILRQWNQLLSNTSESLEKPIAVSSFSPLELCSAEVPTVL